MVWLGMDFGCGAGGGGRGLFGDVKMVGEERMRVQRMEEEEERCMKVKIGVGMGCAEGRCVWGLKVKCPVIECDDDALVDLRREGRSSREDVILE